MTESLQSHPSPPPARALVAAQILADDPTRRLCEALTLSRKPITQKAIVGELTVPATRQESKAAEEEGVKRPGSKPGKDAGKDRDEKRASGELQEEGKEGGVKAGEKGGDGAAAPGAAAHSALSPSGSQSDVASHDEVGSS